MQRREKSVQSVPGIGISNLPQSSGFEALAIDRPRPGIRICKKSLWWALTARAPSQFTLDLELCTVIHLPYQATHQTPTSTHQAYPAGPGPPTRRPPGDLPGTHRTAYPALTGRPTRLAPGRLPTHPAPTWRPTRRPTRRSPAPTTHQPASTHQAYPAGPDPCAQHPAKDPPPAPPTRRSRPPAPRPQGAAAPGAHHPPPPLLHLPRAGPAGVCRKRKGGLG